MIRFPPKRILVPLDFSEPSLAALEDAKVLARRFGASLELVYVQAMPLSLAGFELDGNAAAMPGLVQQMREFRRWREEKMRRAVAGFPPSRARIRSIEGWPPARIADLARGRGADFVVMGTHGYAGMDRALFGSVAEAVVRRAEVPVLTTHPCSSKLRLDRILAACNMERYADKALVYALRWARRLGARASVVHVAPKGRPKEDARAALRGHLESVLGRRAAAKLGLIVRFGDPKQEILEAAVRGRFDLIVLSAHRKPFWSGFVLGSTAERVLRHSPTPVLSIPSTEASRRGAGALGPRRWITDKIY